MNRPISTWRGGRAIVAACIAAMVAGSPASVAAATRAWTIVPSPSGGGLLDVTCVGVSDCWAVGQDASGHGLIERNPGSGWIIVPNPASSLDDAFLNALTCVTNSDCWVVGKYSVIGAGGCCITKTLTEHYDGSSWAIVSSPSPGGDSTELRGVTCANANNCWAFGDYFTGGIEAALIEQFTGGSWVVSNTLSNAFLYRATCATSLLDCWVVGSSLGPPACTAATECTLVEHNAGAGWIMVPSANVPAAAYNFLNGVTCVSADNCWAVGTYTAYVGGVGTVGTLIEHYGGNIWTIVSSPNAPKGNSQLADVSCTSGTNCWAVGDHGFSRSRTLIEHLTGGAWVIVKSVSASTLSYSLDGVTCVSSRNCWAVGSFTDTADKTLIEHHQ